MHACMHACSYACMHAMYVYVDVCPIDRAVTHVKSCKDLIRCNFAAITLDPRP